MKIIHCADLHLDSRLGTNLGTEKAKERRKEILLSFERMVEYAKENSVRAIIIAGDLFDKTQITIATKKIVKNVIMQNSDIDFFYLRGNHDEGGFFEEDEIVPENLKTFNKDNWTTYQYPEENLTISGIEFGKKNDVEIYNSLNLEKDKKNIVILHGQESENDSKGGAEIINLKKLKNKNIDYLALGHIHTYKKEKLDERGIYCYPGCLDGRGFDELGEKGFVLLDIEENSINSEFIKFSSRSLEWIQVDITGLSELNQIKEKIINETEDISEKSLVRIDLTGEKEIGDEIDIQYLNKSLENRFYFVKIEDCRKIKIDYLKYKNDISLKGEFIRLVLDQSDIDEEEKSEIISTGIKALSNEEI